MNGNKKQRRVNLLASQKLGPRSRKGIKKQEKDFFLGNSFLFLKNYFFKTKNIVYFIFVFLKKKPRTTYFFSVIILASIIIKISVYYVENYSERILPTQIQINTDNQNVTNELYFNINRELAKSIKNSEKRSYFLEKVNNIMSSLDIVDQYWIRLGLDGKLQINAIMQIPVMIIEAKNNERYIVSNNMKIISKNPPVKEHPSLLKVEAPEMKISWHPKSYFIKMKKNKSNENINVFPETSGPVNFPWLIKQIRMINSEIQNIGSGYSLAKITWTSSAGFSLRINRNIQMLKNQKLNSQNSEKLDSLDQNLSSQEINGFVALLGDDQIRDKMERLRTLLIDLTSKNIYPSEVDLDFADKATFKILGSAPNSTH